MWVLCTVAGGERSARQATLAELAGGAAWLALWLALWLAGLGSKAGQHITGLAWVE